MNIKIEKLCSACNQEFELKYVQFALTAHGGKVAVANFEDCPHCGKRNDHWVKVTVKTP